MKCIKSAARLLDIDSVNKGGLDLSKEELCIAVGQRAAKLRAVKKNFSAQPGSNQLRPRWADRQNFF